MKPKIAVIIGPTATGKSKCGLSLAQKLQTEIISGDSMLVYQGMNIGTAKPSAEELKVVRHHLVDILNPCQEFSVYDFKIKAEKAILDINAGGKIPLLVGGTGLYVKALLEDYAFAETGEKTELRAELEHFAESRGREELHLRLAKLDSETASRLHFNDVRRVIRAIETALQGEQVSQEAKGELAYDAVVFGLRMPRARLYARIDKRVEEMIAAGLFTETKDLLAANVPKEAQSMKSIGYRQAVQYLQGELSWEEAIGKIKQYTRNFAKRQVTWYKKMPYIQWFDLDDDSDHEVIASRMYRLLVKRFNLL